MNDPYVHAFKNKVSHIPLPDRFTFPFYYTPHELSKWAAIELQERIEQLQDHWEHNFGFVPTKKTTPTGKMFGVLVVKDSTGKLGYLSAFSGMLNGTMNIPGFVPAAYDKTFDVDYFHQQFDKFNALSQQLTRLQQDPVFISKQKKLSLAQSYHQELLAQQHHKHQQQRKARKQHRSQVKNNLDDKEWGALLAHDHQLQLNEKFLMREYEEYLNNKNLELQEQVSQQLTAINRLEQERKTLSLQHQDWIFKHYNLLNIKGESKNVVQIFSEKQIGIPPSSTGDCAAPKLLQYAFTNKLTPIAMAEFWYGASPNSNIRKHLHYYPSCRSKCEPILDHMLQGLPVDDNPMMINPASGKQLKIVYEDDAIVIINKPAAFLSVPGKNIKDSVLTRMQTRYPQATGPLLVHRLDMDTSGILIMAKTKKDHQRLQEQFINKTILKKYIAVLDGMVTSNSGEINLPLRVDLDNRPSQMICYEHGKPARTIYKVIEVIQQHTRVELIPITGRTHQLRVHMAHSLGLDTSIKGDDLYGTKSDRLYLHAAYIKFTHPRTQKTLSFHVPPDF